MARRLVILPILLFIAIPAFAQLVDTMWVRRYNGPGNGDDWTSAIAVDNSGNVYVAGANFATETDDDYATIKYDPSGKELWVRTYNGPGNGWDWVYDMTVDNAGNVCVTGRSWGDTTSYDYATIKYDSDGNELWVQRYNGPGNDLDWATSIGVDTYGNVYVTGSSWSNETEWDYTTIKYDSNGDTLWIRRYDGYTSRWDLASDIFVDGSFHVYATGQSDSTGTGDYATVKYDEDGNQLWAAVYNGPGGIYDAACGVAVDDFGNVYVTGDSYGGETNEDYGTIKYYPNGDTAWIRRYDGPAKYDFPHAIAVDASGNVYVTGQSYGISWDYLTVKYDSSGNEIWTKRFNGARNWVDVARAITVDSSGNVYVTGYGAISHDRYFDYATIKYDHLGNELWLQRYNGTGNGNDEARSMAVDGSGNVYVTGRSFGHGTGYDCATIKYLQAYALRGDVDADGLLTITDIAHLIDYLFKDGPAPNPILPVADVNCDRIVDLVDAVYLINYLLKGGPPPCQ